MQYSMHKKQYRQSLAWARPQDGVKRFATKRNRRYKNKLSAIQRLHEKRCGGLLRGEN